METSPPPSGGGGNGGEKRRPSFRQDPKHKKMRISRSFLALISAVSALTNCLEQSSYYLLLWEGRVVLDYQRREGDIDICLDSLVYSNLHTNFDEDTPARASTPPQASAPTPRPRTPPPSTSRGPATDPTPPLPVVIKQEPPASPAPPIPTLTHSTLYCCARPLPNNVRQEEIPPPPPPPPPSPIAQNYEEEEINYPHMR